MVVKRPNIKGRSWAFFKLYRDVKVGKMGMEQRVVELAWQKFGARSLLKKIYVRAQGFFIRAKSANFSSSDQFLRRPKFEGQISKESEFPFCGLGYNFDGKIQKSKDLSTCFGGPSGFCESYRWDNTNKDDINSPSMGCIWLEQDWIFLDFLFRWCQAYEWSVYWCSDGVLPISSFWEDKVALICWNGWSLEIRL